MSESTSSSLPLGPGALIEAARSKKGLHIATLAAQLKVSPTRLEALEREQWDKLPDLTNARALATTVCRALGLDPAPVLAGMPRASGDELDRVTVGLNEPVRSGHALSMPRWGLFLLALAVVGVVLGIRYWPRGDAAAEPAMAAADTPVAAVEPQASEPSGNVPASASDAASLPPTPMVVAASQPVAVGAAPALAPAAQAASVVATTAAQGSPTSAAPVGDTLLEIRATAGESWVSVVDASGSSLASRLLLSGETLRLQAQAPVRLVLGNAPALSLSWRGQNQALEGYEQRRVARLELK